MDTITIPVKEYKRLLRVDRRVEETEKKKGFADVAFGILREKTSWVSPMRVHAFPFSFVGSGRSRGTESGKIAERHDEALADAFSA